MRMRRPLRVIVLGFCLVLFGFVGPFLMVLDIVETSLTFSLLSHAASVSGLFLGLLGTAIYAGARKR